MLAGGVGVLRLAGKRSLHNKTTQPFWKLQEAVGESLLEEEAFYWQPGWVKYQGEIYQYNEEILTFLIMGIDKRNPSQTEAGQRDGGQADALFLAVVNQKSESIAVVGINRNTMTDIALYDENGDYAGNGISQIAIAHGFGGGGKESCGYQLEAVQNLFYGMPIHGYAAINMGAIGTLNDAVGGVDVEVLEDLTKRDAALEKGKQVHLTDETAYVYVQYRDTGEFASADMRLARQKQYLCAYIDAAGQAVKRNVFVVKDLYQALKPYMVTDISPEEALYLAPVLADYRFDADSFYLLEGDTVMGERYEEFYPDEERLYELLLELFYEKKE